MVLSVFCRGLNERQNPGVAKDILPSSGLPVKRRIRSLAIPFLIAPALMASPAAQADEVQDFAQLCDDAIGVTVPDFDCDAGTEVPGQGSVFRAVTCDEPNRLNRECDPGSRFQVLTRSDDAYVVAHCRHENGNSGNYGDIAVIQYNRKNGATCFYQSLGNQSHGDLPGGHTAPNAPAKPVHAPLKGGPPSWPWMLPSAVAHVTFACGGCHDNGPLIRSPYLNQIKTPLDPNVHSNALPGSDYPGSGGTGVDGFFFNKDQPYAFVGQDFASWKAFKVEVGNECNGCHRLGVNNVLSGKGTALDFGIRATAASEVSKNGPSAALCGTAQTPNPACPSPIWMPPVPVQVAFNQAHADSAKAIHDCALRFRVCPGPECPPNYVLPDEPTCRITLFAAAYTAPPPPPPPPPEDIATIIPEIFAPADIATIIPEIFAPADIVTIIMENN